jgi:hypothetical protein
VYGHRCLAPMRPLTVRLWDASLLDQFTSSGVALEVQLVDVLSPRCLEYLT